MTATTDPLGHTTAFEYDGANNRTALINAALKRFDFEYDDHNNLVRAIDPRGKVVSAEYNTDDLPTKTVDQEGKGSRFEYDSEGRLVKAIDGAGNETVYHYDESLETVASSYKPVQIDYPTYTRKITYDSLQRIVRETDIPDGNTTHSASYTYDAGGNIVSKRMKRGIPASLNTML